MHCLELEFFITKLNIWYAKLQNPPGNLLLSSFLGVVVVVAFRDSQGSDGEPLVLKAG